MTNTWYRFGGINDSYIIQSNCLETMGACQTISPGWMLGSHPQGSLSDLTLVISSSNVFVHY